MAVAPSISGRDLRDYLNTLATCIMETDESSPQRLELAALAFKTVIEDLPDESKRLGIDWWLEWRDRFEGRVVRGGVPRARL